MTITLLAGLTGASLSGTLTSYGFRRLGAPVHRINRLPVIGAAVGAFVGCAAATVAHRSAEWPLLPAFLLWGCVLVAAGLCDARTHRIPTVLVRPGFVGVAVLLALGHAVGRDWSGLVLAAVASFGSATTLAVCCRFLGAGLGDVRMAALGGLGLGSADERGLLVGFLLFSFVVLSQLVWQRGAGKRGPALIPLGPALAVGFIAAMVLSAMA